MKLANFDIDLFLRDYWQKRPLLIRNPWVEWHNPLDPDELAGLACEEGIEARLIKQKRKTWHAEHGPFPESRFDRPDKDPWTLLVQAVDHDVPAVAALIEPFRFVPNWRIDDVMVSFATDGGGVGPHFDQYDVFLIQGLGRRRWQLGGTCDAQTPLAPNDDMRLLAKFEPVEEWILEPGDILYVPPRIAHNGIALGDDCMTYSIGFRAPSRSELVGSWCDDVLDGIDDDDRYEDPDLALQANPGEITPQALARLHAMLTKTLQDRDAFARWFGAWNSTRKYPEADWRPGEPIDAAQMRQCLGDDPQLFRSPSSRFSFVRGGDQATVSLFVDGEYFECAGDTAAFAQQLCACDRVVLEPGQVGSDAVIELAVRLFNQGSVVLEEHGWSDDQE